MILGIVPLLAAGELAVEPAAEPLLLSDAPDGPAASTDDVNELLKHSIAKIAVAEIVLRPMSGAPTALTRSMTDRKTTPVISIYPLKTAENQCYSCTFVECPQSNYYKRAERQLFSWGRAALML